MKVSSLWLFFWGGRVRNQMMAIDLQRGSEGGHLVVGSVQGNALCSAFLAKLVWVRMQEADKTVCKIFCKLKELHGLFKIVLYSISMFLSEN